MAEDFDAVKSLEIKDAIVKKWCVFLKKNLTYLHLVLDKVSILWKGYFFKVTDNSAVSDDL